MGDRKFADLSLNGLKTVSDCTDKVVTDTEYLISNVIPEKIVLLKKIVNEEILPFDDITSVTKDLVLPTYASTSQPTENKKRKKEEKGNIDDDSDAMNTTEAPSQLIPCNLKLTRLIDIIKPEVKDMIDICEQISLWIQLLTPKVEDGNNFGVEVQQEVQYDVCLIKNESLEFLTEMSHYFTGRGKVASKIRKYPYLEDYRRALKEVDDKEYLKIRAGMIKMGNNYVVILGQVSKNYAKIKKPRSQNNVESMY